MTNSFFSIAQQVLMLFLLIGMGAVCEKTKIVDDQGIKTCTNIVLYAATPCVIIKSYIRKFSPELLSGLLISIMISFLIHIVSIIIVHFVFRSKDEEKTKVLRFAVVFSNAGYMALPLQSAVLGDMGVFYGASYIAVFNIVVWTYGVWCMSSDKSSFSAKKIINPGVISVIIGAAVFLFSVPVSPVLYSAVSNLAALNTPLPMIIIGYYLAQCNLLEVLKDKATYMVVIMKLIVIPVLALIVMYFLGVRGEMLVSMTIAASAPTAAATTLFSVLYNGDDKLSVNLVSLTTLLSVATMPTIVAFSQYLS